jgi:hypothetical protein
LNITTYLQKQFVNINAVFHAIADDLTDEEWVTRPAPGQNVIGYSYIGDPKGKSASVVVTEAGAKLSKELFFKHFGAKE